MLRVLVFVLNICPQSPATKEAGLTVMGNIPHAKPTIMNHPKNTLWDTLFYSRCASKFELNTENTGVRYTLKLQNESFITDR